jgi:hypothetical protein
MDTSSRQSRTGKLIRSGGNKDKTRVYRNGQHRLGAGKTTRIRGSQKQAWYKCGHEGNEEEKREMASV